MPDNNDWGKNLESKDDINAYLDLLDSQSGNRRKPTRDFSNINESLSHEKATKPRFIDIEQEETIKSPAGRPSAGQRSDGISLKDLRQNGGQAPGMNRPGMQRNTGNQPPVQRPQQRPVNSRGQASTQRPAPQNQQNGKPVPPRYKEMVNLLMQKKEKNKALTLF